MLETRRPPAHPLQSQHRSLTTSKAGFNTARSLDSYALQTSIRLATELAEDGNFVDASRVAAPFRRIPSRNQSLEQRLAERLISRNVASFIAPPGETIVSVQRILGHRVPVILTRTKSGTVKATSPLIPGTKSDIIVVAPDGKTLVFTSGKQLTILKTVGQETLRTDGHDSTVRLIAISDDGSIVASYGDDSLIRIWDAQNGTPLTSVPLRDVGIPYLSISPNGSIVCIAVGNGPAKYINLNGEGDAHALRPRGTHATAICPLPDGRAFVVGCQDGTTRIMEMKMGRESAILEGDGSSITHVTVSPDGRHLLSQTKAGRVSIFEVGNVERTHIWQLTPDTRNINAIFTTNDTIALGISRTSVQTLALSEIDIWKSISLPKVEITDALHCKPANVLICGDTSGRLTKVSTLTGVPSETVQCHRRRIQNIRAHPTNKRWVTMASWDTTASIVDIASLEPIRVFSGHADRVRDAMLSADGLTMVTISDDRTCRFWDARSGKVFGVVTLTERPLAIETCSKDMATIIDIHATRITIKNGMAKPIKVESQRLGTSLTGVRTDGNYTAYLAGSQVAVASVHGGRITTFTSSDRITASFIHPQSRIMLVGTNTGHIQLWDTSTMTELVDVKCTSCEIAAVGYAVSGDYLFAIGVDGQAKYIKLGGPQR